MKNIERLILVTFVWFLSSSAYGQNTDKYGNELKKKYFFVYKEAHGDEHSVFSNTIQYAESNRSIKVDVLSQWMDEIKLNHSDLLDKYGQDRIYSLSYVNEYETREEAEKEKREQMSKEKQKGAKIMNINFTYYKTFKE